MLFHSLVRSLSSKSSSQRSLSRHSLNQLANRFASVFASPVCELFVQCESKPATSDRTRPFGPPSPAPSPANWAIKAGDYRSRVLVCFCVINEVTALASTELHNSAAKFAAVRRSSRLAGPDGWLLIAPRATGQRPKFAIDNEFELINLFCSVRLIQENKV